MTNTILEGLLLAITLLKPKQFNPTKSAPRDSNSKVRKFLDRNLNNFSNSAYEIGLIKDDLKKFSQPLRDFRNYIHQYQQMRVDFHQT